MTEDKHRETIRRNPLRAGVYAAAVVLIAYFGFAYVLKTPLPTGPWGF